LSFVAFLTPYLVESDFIWVTYWLSQKHVTALTLCLLSLATLQPDIQNLALFIRPKEQAGYNANF